VSDDYEAAEAGCLVAALSPVEAAVGPELDAGRCAAEPLAAAFAALAAGDLDAIEAVYGACAADLFGLALSLVRYQSIASLRRLARVAISLRLAALENGRYPDALAAWPEASAPDPFTGGPLRYELATDGSAVVAVPGAEALYDRINQVKSFVPYTWTLPAPPSGTPATTK
jgi:hypothetical protein